MTDRVRRFVAGLRRQRVFRAAAAYVVVGLGVLGAAELILDPLGLGAVRPIVVMVVLVGFPIAMVFSWAHELGPEEPAPMDGTYGAAAISRPSQQDVRFCATADGARIAYSITGSGPPLLRVLGWFTHLENEWQWPELRFFWESLGEHFTLIRYDGRGIGMSDPWQGPFTEEARLLDVDAVLTAADVERAVFMGISEGGWTAAGYALRHPHRVSHLIFYGCYSRGLIARPGYDAEVDEALMTLVRKGWGRDDPSFRRVFTSDFFSPDADPRLLAHFDELQRSSAAADTAARYMDSIHRKRWDGREMFEQLRTPSLVLHQRGDRVITFEEGRRLATLIPDATFQILNGQEHYFPLDFRSAPEVAGHIARFAREGDPSGAGPG